MTQRFTWFLAQTTTAGMNFKCLIRNSMGTYVSAVWLEK